MTQPEQEAREMLAAEWGDSPQWQVVRENILDGGCNVLSDPISLANSLATRALTKALARPTAGIDREIARMREIANDWRRPALAQVEGPNDLKIYGGTIADDIDRWADMLEAPAAAKTGEREPLPIDTAPKDGTRVLALSPQRGIWEVMRWDMPHDRSGYRTWCLDEYVQPYELRQACPPTHWQPLPDAPIVSGEG